MIHVYKNLFLTLFAKIETWIHQCFCKSGVKMPTSAMMHWMLKLRGFFFSSKRDQCSLDTKITQKHRKCSTNWRFCMLLFMIIYLLLWQTAHFNYNTHSPNHINYDSACSSIIFMICIFYFMRIMCVFHLDHLVRSEFQLCIQFNS